MNSTLQATSSSRINGGVSAQSDMVNLIIDGKPVAAPKGTNLIEAARSAEIDIPHYCYHPHLSIAGNCRMCQVRVKGMPKMEVACNMQVKEGMEVATHHTSQEVADTQAAVLEFILINHPLDCTVCDQAGHCKLQDYHYQYNARKSRFIEDKVRKSKVVDLGKHVMLDGERCIMCSRCVRFCSEVTKTSELGMLNRGDRTIIAINPGKRLDNPLSGTVVDLCPVGALTHKEWRFNTRIWFTDSAATICPGCSTGCNIKVHARDGEVVQVKARLNSKVNKEWLCDEGRYGLSAFVPAEKFIDCMLEGRSFPVATLRQTNSEVNQRLKSDLLKASKDEEIIFLLSSDLLNEEYRFIAKEILPRFHKKRVALRYQERALTDLEKILVSPDRAPNYRGAQLFLDLPFAEKEIEAEYRQVINEINEGKVKALVVIGDNAFFREDLTSRLQGELAKIPFTLVFAADLELVRKLNFKVALPIPAFLEKSGSFVSRRMLLQYLDPVFHSLTQLPDLITTLNQISLLIGGASQVARDARQETLEMLEELSNSLELGDAKLKIATLKLNNGVTLKSLFDNQQQNLLNNQQQNLLNNQQPGRGSVE